jgi:hypothetical protein
MKNITILATTRAKRAPPYFQQHLSHRHGSNLITSGSTIEREPSRVISTQHPLPINSPRKSTKTSRVPMDLNYPCCDQRLDQQQALKPPSFVADNLFYDFVHAEEIETAHKIEVQGMD